MLNYSTVNKVAQRVIDFFGANLEMEFTTKKGKVSIYMSGEAYIKTIADKENVSLYVRFDNGSSFELEGALK